MPTLVMQIIRNSQKRSLPQIEDIDESSDTESGGGKKNKQEEKQIHLQKEEEDEWHARKLKKSHKQLFGSHPQGRQNLKEFRQLKLRHHVKSRSNHGRYVWRVVAPCDVYQLGGRCSKGAKCRYSHRLPKNDYHNEGTDQRELITNFLQRISQ